MVVVRESPRVRHSPDKNSAQWPPKSPFEALLSSPSGRKKWQDHRDRADERSPSPSPMRRQPNSSQNLQNMLNSLSEDDAEEEDEDEEMLQLKLQQIETRLKLKKLQRARRENAAGEEPSRSPRKLLERPPTVRSNIEVPLSPVRTERPPMEQVSPARRRLGLDAPFRAQEVSLKRARPTHGANAAVRRSEVLSDTPRVKSFSERLIESKEREEKREARKERLESIRTSAFGHSQGTISGGSVRQRPRSLIEPLEEETTSALSRSLSARTPSSMTAGSLSRSRSGFKSAMDDAASQESSSDAGYDPFSQIHLSKRHITHSVVAREMDGKEIYTLPRLLKEIKAPEYDPPDCEADYVVFAVLASKSSPFDTAQSHNSTSDNLSAPTNKFMVLHLCDLKWEIDLFLFGTAFNQFWKLTPGTLLAILNPAIMPPKGNQHSGRFSLKLSSSSDAVMEIGTARDLGYCVSLKKDGTQCPDWIDKRKTEVCEFHMNLQIDKSRKHRMEVNTMFRGEGNAENQKKSKVIRDWRENNKPKTAGKYNREYGTLYSVNTGLGRSAATLLDDDDTDALHNMTKAEASRKRLAAAQKDRDLAKHLGNIGRGVGAEYLRVSTNSSNGHGRSTHFASDADEARSQLFAKPTAAELGLSANDASAAHLSPAKDRKRHFGLGEMSRDTARARDKPMGWGAAKKVGLAPPSRRAERLASPERERGQTTLFSPHMHHLSAPDAETGSMATTSSSEHVSGAATRAGVVRPRSSQGGSSIRSTGSTSPVKKRARFALEKGIREPGRESLPSAVDGLGISGAFDEFDDDDEDDGLDIVA